MHAPLYSGDRELEKILLEFENLKSGQGDKYVV